VVIVGWNDSTSRVSSVTDTKGNVYQLAVGPTILSGTVSQSIYYAKNIAASDAGGNTVTIKFNAAAAYPDIRILEYSGIDPVNPLDAVVAATEVHSATSSSGTIATTNSKDLLVGANIVTAQTAGAGIDFTERLYSSPDGDIAEDRVVNGAGLYSASAPLTGPCPWVMQMVAFRAAGVQPPDTTPPTVSIKTPGAGATLTGAATVTVNASDSGTGVAGVQLQIDGVPFGTASKTSPYTFSVNTAQFANGSHTITASAFDWANNVGAANVSVTFSNSSPGNPATLGVWSGTVPLPIVSVNSVLLPSGKLLMWDGQSSFGTTAIVWSPIANTTEWAPTPSNIFCTGQEQLADGRIIVVGGHLATHNGLPNANLFDPSTETWTAAANMAYPRWYPTATTLPDGSVMVTSGETNCNECDETINEIYSQSTNSWTQLTSAPFSFPYYPHVFVLPDGRILVPSTGEAPITSQVLDLSAHTWTPVGGPAVDGGTSVMYLPSKFLKLGTCVDPDLATRPSVAIAYVLDMTQTTPTWRQLASMAFPRTYQNVTLLPDGNVLVTGGGTTTGAKDVANAVLPAELWSPTTESWTTMASMSAPRLYHSEAVLLPDGRILMSGGGRFDDNNYPTDQFSAEFFAPPYLFKGQRPVITSAPSQLSYGQNFTVQTPDATRIAKVSLIRFGSVTHAIDMSQRFLPLSFSVGTGSLTITAPVNANLAPPGNYMLFLVDTNGVPSVAAIVHF
jgi:Domain of unknown function (DUF1929)/Bacterial Ig domain